MQVYLLTKQLVLGPTTTTPMVVGIFDSFYKATSISDKWTKISEVQWGFRHENVDYIVTEHVLK